MVTTASQPVRLFHDRNALDSLRSSDFDAVSAYGEVVDNSLDARAKNVRIQIASKRQGRSAHQHIEQMAFGDDGHGMDAETLARCLTIGWSSRFNERDAIGRFGVGMTMAAIHECRRVEVYSKVAGGEWISTYIDLDEVAANEMEFIPSPAPKRVPRDYTDLVGDESGTLVIWSKYDRQSDSADRLAAQAQVWMGRTYRYFIWDDELAITFNGEDVKAVDPLYANLSCTRFPRDPVAERFTDISIDWPVDDFDRPENAPDDSTIVVRMSLLPEELRPEQGSGGRPDTKARLIHMNEGISILRNRREVFYGPIPYWRAAGGTGWPQFEEIDRWWGCEVHFDAVLDRAFTVKNIKRGAIPNKELKTLLKKKILPTRHTCLEKIREVWTQAEQRRREKEAEETAGLRRPGDHERAERTAKKTPTDKSELDRGKDLDTESEEYISRAGSQYDREQQAALKAVFAAQPFTIMEQSWRGSKFFESNHLGGNVVLEYNRSHVFFERVYEAIDSLEADGDPYQTARDLRDLLDLLIIAYAKAEARFAADDTFTAEDFIENLRSNWGQYLQGYVKTWRNEIHPDEQ